MKKTYALVFCLIFLSSQAQSRRKPRHKNNNSGKWSWSASASVFSLSGIKSHTSTGMDAEWMFNDRWSLRGGISFGPDYFKLTTEPFALYLLVDPDDNNRHHTHTHTYRNGRYNGNWFKAMAFILLDSDALCYNMPLSNNLYFSIFASPMQALYANADQSLHIYSLAGVGLKYKTRHFVANATTEFDTGYFWKSSSSGFRANFSIGFIP